MRLVSGISSSAKTQCTPHTLPTHLYMQTSPYGIWGQGRKTCHGTWRRAVLQHDLREDGIIVVFGTSFFFLPPNRILGFVISLSLLQCHRRKWFVRFWFILFFHDARLKFFSVGVLLHFLFTFCLWALQTVVLDSLGSFRFSFSTTRGNSSVGLGKWGQVTF